MTQSHNEMDAERGFAASWKIVGGHGKLVDGNGIRHLVTPQSTPSAGTSSLKRHSDWNFYLWL